MVKCSAIDCNISTGDGVALHRFPKDEKICAAWVHGMRCKNFVPRKDDRLCSKHFTSESYVKLPSGYNALKRNAIPTIFDYPKEYLFRGNNKLFIQCFVPGCKTTCIEGEETGISEERKLVHMFKIPRDSKLFEKWKYALSGSETHLSQNDLICELHFQENDIERQYVIKKSDRNVIEVDRCKITLKLEAIPRLSTELCGNIESNTFIPNTSDRFLNSDIIFIEESTGEKSFSIQDVFQNLPLIKKPSDWWDIHYINDILICVRRNKNSGTFDRKVIIESNLTVKVFLEENEITLKDLVDITCIDDICSLLEKVEKYCFNIGS